MTEVAPTPIVYVDANPFSYFIDGEEGVANRLKPFFELLKERPGLAMTSELTLAEVLARQDRMRAAVILISLFGVTFSSCSRSREIF